MRILVAATYFFFSSFLSSLSSSPSCAMKKPKNSREQPVLPRVGIETECVSAMHHEGEEANSQSKFKCSRKKNSERGNKPNFICECQLASCQAMVLVAFINHAIMKIFIVCTLLLFCMAKHYCISVTAACATGRACVHKYP